MTRTACIIAIATCALVSNATAADYKVGDIMISTPWARATPRGAEVGGAYMTIANKGATADRLLGASSPVAARLEVHAMSMDQGVMKMRPVRGGLEIKPGTSVELKPSSFHLMLIGLKQPLQQGQHFKATLQFEKAGKIDIECVVEGMGATHAASPMGNMGDMGDMGHGAPSGH